ncbi:SDR family NAD(P)-dependent oxidoreductase [Streptomyces shenzhenensis]|uniref:SDR family NAD(P)-dependent oxidoreductase n=1 Tax=Streptomyces shenzhenensis TaxID=943815 RepID=UPI0033DF3A08
MVVPPRAEEAARLADGLGSEGAGRVALVTGGSRGLGAAVVHALAHRGYTVYAGWQHNADLAEEMRGELGLLADRVRLVQGDASDAQWSVDTAQRLREEEGRLDLLVLNAGPSPAGYQHAAAGSGGPGTFLVKAVELVNAPLSGLLDLVRECGGAVAGVSSQFAADEAAVPAGLAFYVAAKRAVEELIRATAAEHPATAFAIVRPPRLRSAANSSSLEPLTAPEVVAAAMADWALGNPPARDVSVLDEFSAPAHGREQAAESEGGLPVAVAATFTGDLIAEAMRACLRRAGVPVGVQLAPFGQVMQSVLDPASVLAANRTGVNWVLLRLEDWLGTDADGTERLVAEAVRFGDAVEEFVRGRVPLIVQVCPPSPRVTGDPATAAAVGRATDALEGRLSGIGNVHLLTDSSWASAYHVEHYHDATREDLAVIPYTAEATAALGTSAARAVHALTHASSKVLVLDADNTLWGGVVGEDGADGVRIGPEHTALQRRAAQWRQEGAVLCVCSKNDEADVRAVFERADMVLSADDITCWRVNWQPKAANIQSLAAELNLGLDSFVFLDDNEVETAAMRAALPEVLTLTVPADAARDARYIDRLWAFDRLVVTDEDRRRAAMYEQSARRDESRRTAPSLAEFIATLDLDVSVTDAGPADLARLSQLMLKTNQFRMTTLRLSEAQLRERQGDGESVLTVRVTDRFGDYGIVGCVLARRRERDLLVESFLLSCRVLGRGVEHRVVAELGRLTRRLGLDTMAIQFEEMPRNQPAGLFLDRLEEAGQVASDGSAPAPITYVLTAEAAAATTFSPAEHETENEDDSTSQAGEAAPAATPAAPAANGTAAERHQALTDLVGLVTAADLMRWIDPDGSADSKTSTAAAGVLSGRSLLDAVKETLAAVGSIPQDRLTEDTWLDEVLMSSLAIVEATARLTDRIGPVPSTLLFEKKTIGHIARELAGEETDLPQAGTPPTAEHRPVADPIAVIGMAGRYPGADNVTQLWDMLLEGRCAVSAVPPHRWDHEPIYSPDPGPHQTNSRWAGLLPRVDQFDPLFFQITPKDATQMDPQQRLFLEVAYEAVQDAGYSRTEMPRQTGVYAGVLAHDYGTIAASAAFTGDAPYRYADAYQIPNRVSFFMDLSGPSIALDTACSSAGTALALACDALRSGQVPMAIAGGVNLLLHPVRFVQYTQMGMLSPRGRCHTFGAEADGIALGEGAGAVLLKPLSKALADGDHVYGVIRGWNVNSGGRTNGFTVPSPTAQTELVRGALAHAGCDASSIDYVEAHGTGTPLGDPIEIQGLTRAFTARDGDQVEPCLVGSIKTNIGHLEPAAGVAGLTKVLLQLQHGMIAPTLNAEPANPAIDLTSGRFRVATEPQPFPVTSTPRRSGVSSFGAGGVNVHLIVEEAPPLPERPGQSAESGTELIVLSAPDPDRLTRYAALLGDVLRAGPGALQDVAYTLRCGRDTWPVRAAFLADDHDSLLAGLRRIAAGDTVPLPQAPATEQEENLCRLAVQWCDGENPDFAAHLPRGQARRVPLPALPYRKTRHWLSKSPLPQAPPRTPDIVPWVLTATSTKELEATARGLLDGVVHTAGFDPAATAAGLLSRTPAGTEHAVILGQTPGDFTDGLRALLSGEPAPPLIRGTGSTAGQTAFLFPGQGAQHPGLGRELYTRFPVFAQALDAVCDRLETELDQPVRDVLFSEPGSVQAERLSQTMFTQAGMFALEVACFRLLESLGIRPDFLLGHSLGELAACHVAGLWSLPDACRLVAARGRLMQNLPAGGAMLAVQTGIGEVEALLADTAAQVSIAAVNGPEAVVLSGTEQEVNTLADTFARVGRRTRRLTVSHAYHSHLMDPMLAAFEKVAASVTYHQPHIPVVSNLTGRVAPASDLCSPSYWAQHVRSAVRFHDGVTHLAEHGVTRLVELGHGTLAAMAADSAGPDATLVPLLRRNQPESRTVLTALARLHVTGMRPQWQTLLEHSDDRRPERSSAPAETGLPQYRISWRPAEDAVFLAATGRVLVVRPAGAQTVARHCVAGLSAAGLQVTETIYDGEADQARFTERLDVDRPDFVLSLAALQDAPYANLEQTVALLRTMSRAGSPARLWCATRGAVAVNAEPPTSPRQALLWGIGRTAAAEHPRTWGGVVDLPVTLDRRSVARLAGILSGPQGEDEYAIRPDGMYIRRLEPIAEQADASAPWRPHGTVLVTGGTGALGSHVARWLAREGAEHIALLSRRGADAAGVAEMVADLKAAGASVSVLTCDVTDRDDVAAALRTLRSGTIPLTAAIHAAGVDAAGMLDTIDDAHLSHVLAPKVEGLVNLHELLQGHDLEAFVLFSSMAGMCGRREHAAYAAGNAFLDAFAEWATAHGSPMRSVAWGPWDGDGMSSDPEVHDGQVRVGWSMLQPHTAVAQLKYTALHRDTVVGVGEVDWSRFATVLSALRPLPLIQDLADSSPDGVPEGSAQEAQAMTARLRGLPDAEQLRLIRAMVRTQVAAVIGLADPDSLSPDTAFRDIGFDSLAATDLSSRINAATGLRLPATLVFDTPTPAALAARIKEELLRTGEDTPVPDEQSSAPDPATEIDTMDVESLIRMATRSE